jgi:hypothetical protein
MDTEASRRHHGVSRQCQGGMEGRRRNPWEEGAAWTPRGLVGLDSRRLPRDWKGEAQGIRGTLAKERRRTEGGAGDFWGDGRGCFLGRWRRRRGFSKQVTPRPAGQRGEWRRGGLLGVHLAGVGNSESASRAMVVAPGHSIPGMAFLAGMHSLMGWTLLLVISELFGPLTCTSWGNNFYIIVVNMIGQPKTCTSIVIACTSQSWASVLPIVIRYTSHNVCVRVLPGTEVPHFSIKKYVLPRSLVIYYEGSSTSLN